MTAFVFVAGLFSKGIVKKKQYVKAVSYIILFIFMKLLKFIDTGIANGKLPDNIDFLSESGVAWFALSMAWWYIITIWLRNVNPIYVLIISIVLALFIGYSVDVNSFLVASRTINFYPFFYLGYITDKDKLLTVVNKRYIKIASVFLILVVVSIAYVNFYKLASFFLLFKGECSYAQVSEIYSYQWGFLWRLCAYTISLLMSVAVISLIPSRNCIFSNLGTRTLPIYVFHFEIIRISLARFEEFRNFMSSGFVVVKCLGFMVVIVMITSFPVLNKLLRKLMMIPVKSE